MLPIRTADTNHNFGPPHGKEGDIGDLPCQVVDQDGVTAVYSVWELTDEERSRIALGDNLRLGVYGLGGAMVPVSLGITKMQRAIEELKK